MKRRALLIVVTFALAAGAAACDDTSFATSPTPLHGRFISRLDFEPVRPVDCGERRREWDRDRGAWRC